jgi:hypothetical protein
LSEPICAVLRGPALVIESATGAYAELIDDRDPVGKPLLELLPELAGTESVAIPLEVLRTGRPITRVLRSRLRDGMVAVLECEPGPSYLPGSVGARVTYVPVAAEPPRTGHPSPAERPFAAA